MRYEAIVENASDVHEKCIETIIELVIDFLANFLQIHRIHDDTAGIGGPVFEHFELNFFKKSNKFGNNWWFLGDLNILIKELIGEIIEFYGKFTA